jgi:hypothetical protein
MTEKNMTTIEIARESSYRIHHHLPGQGDRIAKNICSWSGKLAKKECKPSGDMWRVNGCKVCEMLDDGECDLCGLEPD